jgi:prevent-host-death family protein
MHDTSHKGNVAEAAIAAEAIKLGVPVLRPLVEHTRYDLIFEIAGRLLRVQCKWAPLRGDVVAVNLVSTWYTSRGEQVRWRYTSSEIDAVAVYREMLDECYFLLPNKFDGMSGIYLRVAPPKNGQLAAVHFASDHTLSGAVAQLGERRLGRAEATGSSPVSSTPQAAADPDIVGAHDFRSLFGWYAQRASAGHEILVTRRGKPYVRLLPARDQLALEADANARPPHSGG